MPTPTKGPRFGGSPSHQRLILANLASNLIEHGQITTTEAKAKRLRPYVEHLVTKAKTDTVANRRQVVKVIRDKGILNTLFTEIGPSMATRPGGYTRIIKVDPRKGDNAPMAIIEFVEPKEFTAQTQRSNKSATPAADDSPDTTPAVEPDVDTEPEVHTEPDVDTEAPAEEVLEDESPAADAASDDTGADQPEVEQSDAGQAEAAEPDDNK